MKKHYINPSTSPQPKSYHHVVTVEGGRTIYMSGQVAFDHDRNIVGGDDLAKQARQTLSNMKTAIEAGGGKLTDIVKITTYVVKYRPEQLAVVAGVLEEFFPRQSLPANTLVGVESLSTDGLLVEIEAVAVTDAPIPE